MIIVTCGYTTSDQSHHHRLAALHSAQQSRTCNLSVSKVTKSSDRACQTSSMLSSALCAADGTDGKSASVNINIHIKLAFKANNLKWFFNSHFHRWTWKILFKVFSIESKITVTFRNCNSCN